MKLKGFKYGDKLTDKLKLQLAITFQAILSKLYRNSRVSVDIQPK